MKKNLKKFIALLAVLAMCVSMLAACKSDTDGKDSQNGAQVTKPADNSGTDQSNTAEPVNITWYESTDNEAFATAVADAFNASQSGIHCELVLIPNDDYVTKTKTMLTGGSGDIDVFHVNGVALANSYGFNEVTYDLSDFLANSDLDISKYGGKIEYGTLDSGYLAAMPEGWGGWFLYYNKDIFDKEGIPYPEQLTWNEYAELAKSLTKVKDDGTQQWGGYYPSWTLNLYALQFSNYLTDEDMTHTKEALEFMNRIYNVDKSHMDMATMTATSADPIAMFESGNVAMMINGEWGLGQIKDQEDQGLANVNWSMTYLPTPDGVPAKTGVGGISYVGINNNSKHPNEGWEFIKFLVGPEGAKIYASYGNLPAYVDDEIGQGYLNYYPYDCASLLFDPELKINAEQGKDPNYSSILDLFRNNAELYLLGEESSDDAINGFISDRETVAE
jgi:multiple sugar transport system substrate-binding protein